MIPVTAILLFTTDSYVKQIALILFSSYKSGDIFADPSHTVTTISESCCRQCNSNVKAISSALFAKQHVLV